jgi:hypothetical protein
MSRSARLFSFLILLGGAATASTYPVGARLVLDALDNQHCLRVTGGDRTDCSAVEEAHRAYADAVARMFEPGRPPDIELLLTVESVEIYPQVTGGLSLDMVVRVRVRSPAGEVLDTITSDGRAVVSEVTAVADAAARAAADAARAFEVQYARSEAVANFLVAGGAAPASEVTIGPRSSSLLWFAPGFGLHQGGDTDAGAAPSFRIGGSYGWLMAQLIYGRSSPSFEGAQASGRFPATLHANDIGLDAGIVYRPFSALELRVGPGVHYLFGSAEADGSTPSFLEAPPGNVSYGKLAPTAFASLTASFLPFRNGTRFFAGVEGRGYFFTGLRLPEFGRTVPVADWSLSAMIGIELPWSRASRSNPLGDHR